MISHTGDRAVVECFAASDGEEYEFVVEAGARARIPSYETWSSEP